MEFDFELEETIKNQITTKHQNGYSVYVGFCFDNIIDENCVIVNVAESYKKSFLGNWTCKVFVSVITKLEGDGFMQEIADVRDVLMDTDLLSDLNTYATQKNYGFVISALENISFKNSYSDNGKVSTIELNFILSNV